MPDNSVIRVIANVPDAVRHSVRRGCWHNVQVEAGWLSHELALLPGEFGICFAEVFDRLVDAASSAGGKWYECFAFELFKVIVNPRVDDSRANAPPDGITDIDCVVGHDVGALFDCGSFFGVGHFK